MKYRQLRLIRTTLVVVIVNRTSDEGLGQTLLPMVSCGESGIANKFGQIATQTEDRLNYNSTIAGISPKDLSFITLQVVATLSSTFKIAALRA